MKATSIPNQHVVIIWVNIQYAAKHHAQQSKDISAILRTQARAKAVVIQTAFSVSICINSPALIKKWLTHHDGAAPHKICIHAHTGRPPVHENAAGPEHTGQCQR